jgi:hypothetical protein
MKKVTVRLEDGLAKRLHCAAIQASVSIGEWLTPLIEAKLNGSRWVDMTAAKPAIALDTADQVADAA